MKNKALVFSLNKKFDKFKKKIERTSLKILGVLNQKGVLIEIYLIDSGKIRAINRQFRKKDKATDILSFIEPKNFPQPEINLKRLGEIYLNLDYQRPGAKYNHRRLLIHGILHLFGYDHEKKNDRIKMEKKEQLIIKKL